LRTHALLALPQRLAPRHFSTLHTAVDLEAKVIVQPARRVLLDDEAVALLARDFPARLAGDAELALGVVGLQAHAMRSLFSDSKDENRRPTDRVPRPQVRALSIIFRMTGLRPRRPA